MKLVQDKPEEQYCSVVTLSNSLLQDGPVGAMKEAILSKPDKWLFLALTVVIN